MDIEAGTKLEHYRTFRVFETLEHFVKHQLEHLEYSKLEHFG